MGIIRRQSILSSVLQYVGAAIGFANKVLLFTRFLSTEEVGLANIIVTNAMLLAQFAAIGFGTATLRFFPYFQDKSRRHHNFLFWLLAIPTVGFLLVSALVLLFRPAIFDYFEDKSPLMNTYFWYLFPLALATLYFDLFDNYLRSLLKTVVPVLFREIVQRLLITLSITVYAIGWIDFPQFVMLYVTLLCSVTFLIILYTWWLGQLHLSPRLSWRISKASRKIIVYGGYTLLGNISAIILYNIDGLMLAKYIGMDAVGIYTTAFYVTALIMIPWRAIQKIASPQVAELWKNENIPGLQSLYKRTTLINSGVSIYLFGIMVLGIPTLFKLMPNDFSQGASVLMIIGIGRILDMITGLNTWILITSKYYRIELYLSLFMLVIGILMNLYFIPRYGIEGAAIATGLAITIANLNRLLFLWIKWGLNPFSMKMTLVLAVGLLLFAGVYFVPMLEIELLNFGAKTIVFTVAFGLVLFLLNAIPDYTNLVKLTISKARTFTSNRLSGKS